MKKEFKNKSLRGIRVEVTKYDISRGASSNLHCCPVALATRRTLGLPAFIDPAQNVAAVTVDGELLDIVLRVSPREKVTYELPKRVKKFVVAFDKRQPVEPFSFRIGRKAA